MESPFRRQIEAVLALGTASAIAAVCAALLTGGCSAVLGIESDRHVVVKEEPDTGTAAPSDAGADTASDVPANWACLDEPVPTPGTAPVHLKLFINDVATASSANNYAGNPVLGATVRACATLDIACASSVASSNSDDGGNVALTLPPAFSGFFEVQAPGFTPSLFSRSPQFHDEYAQQGVGNLSLIALGGQLVGVQADPNLGLALISAIDCNAQPSAGVTFDVGTLTAGERLFYLDRSLPSANATTTDSTGSAVLFNVQPGTLTISARLAGTGRLIRAASTFTRSNWVTYIQLRLDQTHVIPIDGGP